MLAITVAFAAVMAVATSPAGGVVVTLRVESTTASTASLFDGTVTTTAHAVDGNDGGGPHPCWGPPGSTPAPTATGALDDAMRGAGISWRGNWDPSFRDFFIDRIGPYSSAPPDSYWSLTVNGRFSAGGCLTRVEDGDSIRFFYGPLFGTDPSKPPVEGGGSSPPAGKAPGGSGRGTSGKRLRRIAARAARYLQLAAGNSEAWARLALALRGSGQPSQAAADLIETKIGSLRPDGSLGGDVNATALAVLAFQERKPAAAARAGSWLATQQTASGGFGYRSGVPPDVDTTGLASWALAIEHRLAAARRAAAFIRLAQSPDGGFPTIAGGASNSQSTGLGIIALRVSGFGPRRAVTESGDGPLDYLASLSRGNGSIAYDSRRSSPTPVWTTAQSLLGLTARAKLLAVGR